MKQKLLAKYLKIGILFCGISFLFTNCEKEHSENTFLEQAPKFTVQTLNREQIQLNSSISGKLKEFGQKDKSKTTDISQSREIHNAEYGFTISTDYAKYIEDTETGNHSYSFPVIMDNPSDDKVVNLLLHSNLDNGYDAYIIQYGFTASEYVSMDENPVNNYSTTLSSIDFDTSVFDQGELNKMVYGCTELWEWVITHHGDQGELVGAGNVDPTQMGWALTGITCGYYDDGGGGDGGTGPGTGDGSSSGGGSGSGSGGSTGTGYDPSDPNNHGGNLPVLAAPAIDTPCSGLSNLLNKPIANQTTPKTVKDNLNHLKNNLNQNKEMVYFMTPIDMAETQFVENYAEGLPNEDEVSVDLGTNAVSVLMHCHYSSTNHLSVFSLADLYQIYIAIDAGNIFSPSTFTSIVVTVHGTNYAIKVSDTQAFLNWATTFFIGWDAPLSPEDNPFIDARERDYEKYVEKGQSNNKNEHGIASFFSDKNLGLQLYRSDNNFSNWSKITPNSNGTTTATPCP